jgi:hypothetical protein
MPYIPQSSYPGAPFWQFNGHLQTLAPSLLRKIDPVPYTRQRITTPDEDFLDLDWWTQGSERLLVLTHGLEGNSTRHYILGMARLFYENGWDILAWNCRSCSGEMNKAFKLYHHGDIEDISTVINHALREKAYQRIDLTGFSLGANITMKYLGVLGETCPPQIQSAVVFSAPCALESASILLDRWDNQIYWKKFYKSVGAKMVAKEKDFPGSLPVEKLSEVKEWRDFDEWFSAPICGYRDADEFYEKSSANNFIHGIRVPCLLVNAINDPILSPDCMPVELAQSHAYFHLETPASGGHCGFMLSGSTYAWSEFRALEFCSESRR